MNFNIMFNLSFGQPLNEVGSLKKTDCIVIGGGIAGLQAAIQLGRYQTPSCSYRF